LLAPASAVFWLKCFLCDFFSSVQEVVRRLHLSCQPPVSNRQPKRCHGRETGFEQIGESASQSRLRIHQETTAAWKQEVNQRLAAHRNVAADRMPPQAGGQNARQASGRAAEAAARVAARYAKAPSYSEILAGEARAAVRAAEAAAEAALNAHAAAQAVLDGLENRPLPPHLWQPANNEKPRRGKNVARGSGRKA
jgi:hypothetical protein